ncbi:MAG: hypothetical protein ACT4PW_09065, partial [Acidimicrobiia bacterium]
VSPPTPPHAVTSNNPPPGRAGPTAGSELGPHDVIAAAHDFTGHLGVEILRPGPGARNYTLVVHFDTIGHLEAWLESDTRQEYLARVEPLLDGPQRIEIRTGLEFWFVPSPGQAHPAAWKQWLVTLSALYPLIFLVPWAWGPGFRSVPLFDVTGTRQLATAATITALLTFVIMPRYTRLVRSWLYAPAS